MDEAWKTTFSQELRARQRRQGEFQVGVPVMVLARAAYLNYAPGPGDLPRQVFEIPVREPIELDGLSREDIWKMRKEAWQRLPDLGPAWRSTQEPSPAWKRIQSGSRWIGVEGHLVSPSNKEFGAVWDSGNGKLRLKINQGRLLAGAISAPAGVVAAASHEDSIRMYNLADGKFLRALPAGPATVGLDFVNNGQWLATGFRFMRARDRDCAIIYDWKTGRALTPQLSHPNFAGYSVSANGHRLITRDDLRCRVWDGASGKLILEHPLACPTIDSLSADGRMVASMTRESDDVLIWRPDTGQEFCRLHYRTRPYGFRFFSTDMAQVLHGGCSVWQVTPPR